MEHKTIYKLYQYAFCGDDDFFMGLLKELAIMSEEEIWFSSDKEYLDILKFYILNVFDKAFEDNLIIEENECSIFNTGLIPICDVVSVVANEPVLVTYKIYARKL